MNSSRDKARPLTIDEEERQRARRAGAAVGVAMLAFAIGAAIWFWLQPGTAQHLQAARAALLACEADPKTQRQQSQAAEQALRKISRGTTSQLATRDLLLVAALSVQTAAAGVDYATGTAEEIEQRQQGIEPALCDASDLRLAAALLYRCERREPAYRLASAALQQMPTDAADRPQALALAMQAALDLGLDDQALKLAQELAELRPQSPEPYRAMALIHETSGRLEPLIATYEKLLEIEKTAKPEIQVKLITQLLEAGQTAKAETVIKQMQAEAPETLAKHPLLAAELAMQQGRIEEAHRLVEPVVASDFRNEAAVVLQARLLLAQQKSAEALALLQRYIEVDQYSHEAHYQLGQAYAREGDQERAKEHLERHRRLLDARVRIQSLTRQAAYERHNADIRIDLARLYDEVGEVEQAQQWAQAAAALRAEEFNH